MTKDVAEFSDPFAQARIGTEQKFVDDQGENITLVLGHRDVRKCAHDHRRFQSGAEPGRIVIPSEENIRDLRQIPFEVDPPMHKDYRNLLEDWFRRPQQEAYQNKINELLRSSLANALASEQVELVHDFSLPL